jgi:hypothetical protein
MALPNLPLNSDPACIVFRSLSTFCYLGFVHRLGAGAAGNLPSLGVNVGLVYEFQLKSMPRFFDRPARMRPTASRSIGPKAPKALRHTASACPSGFSSFGGISLLFSRFGRYASNIRQSHVLFRSLPAFT